MIKSITFKNFKSYKSGTLHLAPLTFLIGPNASGKSNALEAVRLLSWLAKGKRLEDITRDIREGKAGIRGDLEDLITPENSLFYQLNFEGIPGMFFRKNQEKTLHFGKDYSLKMTLTSKEYLSVLDEELTEDEKWRYRVTGVDTKYPEALVVEHNNFKPGRQPQISCTSRLPVFYQLQSKLLFDSKYEDQALQVFAITSQLKDFLGRVSFVDPKPSRMRGLVGKHFQDLEENGANVSGILYKVLEDVPKEEVLGFVKYLPEQNFTDIDFAEFEETNEVILRLEETFGDKKMKINARLLSDGTLRVLAIAAALLNAKENSLVIIEEVDNGVHPSRAKDLIEQIQKVAKERNLQVLLTSHNPALIDAAPDDAIGDIVACYRDPKEGDSRLTRLKDLNDFGELVAQGPVGELMKRQILDRYLKPELTPEEKQARDLEWLQSLITDTEE